MIRIGLIKLEYDIIIKNLSGIIEEILIKKNGRLVIKFFFSLNILLMTFYFNPDFMIRTLTFNIRYRVNFNSDTSKLMLLIELDSLFL
jgi:hypothetical protein